MAKEISSISRQIMDHKPLRRKSKSQEWAEHHRNKNHEAELKSMIEWANKAGGEDAAESE